MNEVLVGTPGLRREPKQARSRARVDAAIAALSDMVGRGDDRSITVADIAERIGVPVGSLYEYFEDVDSIADAAVARMLDRHDEILRATKVDAVPTTHDFVDALFDAYLQLYYEQPAFVRLRHSALWNERHREWLVARVEGFLLGTAAVFLGASHGAAVEQPLARFGLVFSAADAMLTRLHRDADIGDPVQVADARATLKFMVDRIVGSSR